MRRLVAYVSGLALFITASKAWAADLVLDGSSLSCPTADTGQYSQKVGSTCVMGGRWDFGNITLKNNAIVKVVVFDGSNYATTGNLVLHATGTISVDATSVIAAKGAGYQGALCQSGPGPSAYPKSGGRGGCAVKDSGGGGAHFGIGGRGTKDCFLYGSSSACDFPQEWEQDCGSINASKTACNAETANCYSYASSSTGLPTVAGQPFQHSIYDPQFGAAGGDKGCRDGWDATLTAGSGGGRIVLFAANAAQTGVLDIKGIINAAGNRGCASGNDSAGGGAGGTILLIGDNVSIAQSAVISAAGGRGGDSQPKCLTCTANSDCQSGQSCTSGRCSPCNCTPCTANAQCSSALGQTCKNLGGDLGTVCADTSNQCTPFPSWADESECKSKQNSGTCDDCGGGGGGGIINVQSRVASIDPRATFNVSGAAGGICPICSGEAGGGAGELQIDGAYVGEVCDAWDNDFSGTADDNLPSLTCDGSTQASCSGGLPQQCAPSLPACKGAVTDTRPRFAVVVDTSGSMLLDPSGYPTFGDGSQDHPGVTTSGGSSRLAIAKGALNNVLAAFTNADFSLARYHQDVAVHRSCQTASWFECQSNCCSYDDPRNNVAPAEPIPPACVLSSLYPSAGYPAALSSNINIGWASQSDCINYAGSCGPPRRGADFLVGFGKPLKQTLMWLDGKETSFNTSTLPGDHCGFSGGGDCELRATGPTPLASALDAAADYLSPIVTCDGAVPCRKYAVILLTDGAESCMGDPIASATTLRTAVSGTTINTYVIGFSVLASEQTQLNAIASAGGTGAAYFASDQSSLSNALASIIAASTNYEKCNGLDDNCNGLIDEDFPDKGTACDDGKQGVCKGTGTRVCNAAGDGTICQITNPGQSSGTEKCNGLDDDCDGLVDEDGVCQICVPSTEVCNGKDDDCDGVVDNGPVDANQACGLVLGECKAGVTQCAGGVLQCVGNVGPSTEVCDGKDNDCDGVVDGFSAPCYTGDAGTEDAGDAGDGGSTAVGVCRGGTRLCTGGQWGACVGEVVPSAEICDGLDNDCNGKVDDQVSDGFGHVTGEACCRFASKCGVGVCTSGAYACAGSQVVCDGGTGPSLEVCDGLDNDCNGTIDDVAGRGTACVLTGGCGGTLECQSGTLTCVTGQTSLEVCNGVDDDCNGLIDDVASLTANDPRVGVSCDAPVAPRDQGPCKAGTTVCRAGAIACEGSVQPSTEVCNGIDDDCDGTIDDPNPCQGDTVCYLGQCLSPCGHGEFACPGLYECINGVCVPEGLVGSDGGVPADAGSSALGSGGAPASEDAGTGGAGPSTSAATASSTAAGGASSATSVVERPTALWGKVDGQGCGCSVPGRSRAPLEGWWVLLVGASLAVVRRGARTRDRLGPGRYPRKLDRESCGRRA